MTDRTAYGGQAVIEGVMIRGKALAATACRLKDGTITVRCEKTDTITQHYPWLRFAFLRGMPALIDSLRLGYRTLMWSADIAMEGEKVEKPSPFQYFLTIAVSLIFGIGLFVLFPTVVLKWVFPHAETMVAGRGLLEQLTPTLPALVHNIAEGLLRVLMLVGYITIIGMNKEIRRVFSYHGAEHKVVNAWEAGVEMVVSAIKPFSRIHPRCGTSFLFLVFVVGILMHALIGWPEAWLRVVSRLLMLPIIAGVSYEVLRLAGRFRDSKLLKLLVWPGMLLQRLTTAEPTDDQIEVAVHSLRSVLIEEGVLPPDMTEPTATVSGTEQTAIA